MYKVVLFDLDGTLLPLDMDIFIRKYFKVITDFFQDLIEPDLFLKTLLASTQAMMKNSDSFTNEEIFMKHFLPAVGYDRETMEPYFNRFYAQEFPKLKQYAGYSEWAAKVVAQFVEKGSSIVIASNPVFPRAATEARMSWAGVADFSWSLVTSYENSRNCKPSIQYYQEICRLLKVSPKDCLMVGNDVQEDLVAGEIGMETYLVTDCLIDRGKPKFEPGNRGNLAELYSFAQALSHVK